MSTALVLLLATSTMPSSSPGQSPPVNFGQTASAKSAGPDDGVQAMRLADAVRVVAPALPSTGGAQTQGGGAGASSLARPETALSAGFAPSAGNFSTLMRGDSDLETMVSGLLAEQVAPNRRVLSGANAAARTRVVRALVATLCNATPPTSAAALRDVYENGYRAADRAQLTENERLGRTIHAALARAGQVSQYEYRRSEAYKRIVRRRIYLAANPQEEPRLP